MLSSNLYKSNWVIVQPDDKRVIDNNALLEEKLSTVLYAASLSENEYPEEENGFAEGLNAESADALFAQEGSKTVVKGGLTAEKEALLHEIDQAKAELAELQAQADGMIEEARSQIDAMQKKAYEEAKTQGFQEGERLGRQEAEVTKKEYLAKEKRLAEDYEKKIEQLEPEFIETLTGIYEHIFKVDLTRYRELVANLLINAIQKMESTRSFLVHISRDDYENVLANRDRIRAEAGGGSVSVEFVEDVTLSRSQCFIETENGIYDCSLDTQLSELGRKLKLISYNRD